MDGKFTITLDIPIDNLQNAEVQQLLSLIHSIKSGKKPSVPQRTESANFRHNDNILDECADEFFNNDNSLRHNATQKPHTTQHGERISRGTQSDMKQKPLNERLSNDMLEMTKLAGTALKFVAGVISGTANGQTYVGSNSSNIRAKDAPVETPSKLSSEQSIWIDLIRKLNGEVFEDKTEQGTPDWAKILRLGSANAGPLQLLEQIFESILKSKPDYFNDAFMSLFRYVAIRILDGTFDPRSLSRLVELSGIAESPNLNTEDRCKKLIEKIFEIMTIVLRKVGPAALPEDIYDFFVTTLFYMSKCH